jgi:4'-phosphopantetheinyl transferase
MVDRNPAYLAAGMADVPTQDDWMSDAERRRLDGFRYTKRRDEVRLARWTAKRTLAVVLGLDEGPERLRSLVVRNASDGAPEAFHGERPLPLRISMTDRADWAVCIAARGTGEVGCDLELVEPRSHRFVADWFTPAEQRVVAERPDQADLLANLIWSAKESALKVMRTGLRRDTRSVEVDLRDDVSRDGWEALRVTSADGAVFDGWWQRFDQFVLTYAGEHPSGPPVSLLETSPLTNATPSHRWMAQPLTD